MRKIVTVVSGPGVWVGLRGWLVRVEGEFVIAQFSAKDDAGLGTYDVRMPLAFVKIEGEPPRA